MTTASTSNPASSTPLVRQDIEIATRAADHFTRLYYAAYDSDARLADLPKFYRESSSLLWNGKPFQGLDDLQRLIQDMPMTKHEIQSFDCQPVPGTSPPSLLVIVSGNVTHGRGPSGNPPNTPAKTVEGHPRVFSQTFMLVPDTSAAIKPGEVAKYYVSADSLRFVG
ncbi:hypothetical protein D9756_005878 [Leucocoprinus leucothites]|uniref:NTF2 domain-containing protein n=1 Tax=Leucocoprinus leucothites TaxID=201217 RepID=A0A8H5FXM7_9AGAR|nr:hypothetical protein D9756_005878 [Leucoagaricus leucothites]